MQEAFYFSFGKDWREAPLAFWVHRPTQTPGSFSPPAPEAIPHRGYAMLHVPFGRYTLLFSSPAQLRHCIEVLSRTPLPTSQQLSAKRGANVGPNGHWLSRLPAALKAPRQRHKLVASLQAVLRQTCQAQDERFLSSAFAKHHQRAA